MQLPVYEKAVAELAVPKLSAFLTAQASIVEIDGWAKMRAPEKRENMLEALRQSKPLREQFVAFFASETGTEADFSEWEIEVAKANAETSSTPAPGGEVIEETGTEPTPALEPETTLPAAITIVPTTFVEGAFEQIVADVAGLDAKQSQQAVIEVEDKLEFEHIRLGALLSHIQANQHYVTLGFENLRQFIAATTNLDYRKATYLISNHNKVRDLGIPAEQLKGVTWSALRHIVPILTEKNAKKWLEAARSSTHVALIAAVEKEKAKQAGALPAPKKGEANKPEAAPKAKVFNLYPEQKVTVDQAIEKAKQAANVDSTGAALEVISAAYVGAPTSDTTIASVLPDLSPEGLKTMFTKLRADGGLTAAATLLEVFGEVWPEIELEATFPSDGGAQAAE